MIEFDDVLDEYMKRCNIANKDEIDDSIFSEWNEIAVIEAQEEGQRVAEVQRVYTLYFIFYIYPCTLHQKL